MSQTFPKIIFSVKIYHLRFLALVFEDIEGFIENYRIFSDDKWSYVTFIIELNIIYISKDIFDISSYFCIVSPLA